MIRFFYRGSCSSSKQALTWLKRNNIDFEIIKISSIDSKDLVKLLSLTNEGTDEIIKGQNKCSFETKQKIFELNEMTFNKCIDYLKNNTDILQSPIILDDTKFFIGYNSEELRQFLPPKYRRGKLQNSD